MRTRTRSLQRRRSAAERHPRSKNGPHGPFLIYDVYLGLMKITIGELRKIIAEEAAASSRSEDPDAAGGSPKLVAAASKKKGQKS